MKRDEDRSIIIRQRLRSKTDAEEDTRVIRDISLVATFLGLLAAGCVGKETSV